MIVTIYNGFIEKLFQGIDLASIPINAALLDDNYITAKQHDTFTSISSYEISGNGYFAGGKALTGVSISELIGQDAFVMVADDVSWNPSTITAKVVTLYNTDTDELICSFEMDTNEISNNGLFEVQWNADGVLKVSQQVI